MGSLGDTLRQYGATADYWVEAARAQAAEARDEAGEDVPPRPELEEVMSFLRALPDGSERTALASSFADDLLAGKPIYLWLAEMYREKGDADAASDAYEKAYNQILNEHADPEDLRSLGHRLLEGCGADEPPLSERDFDVSWVTFPDGDDLVIRHPSDEPDVAQFPEFVERGPMLNLAIRAFGLAWLYYQDEYDPGISKSQAWDELLALEGLRAALLAADDLTVLQETCDQFDLWLEDWENTFSATGLLDPFIISFLKTQGYLKGRRKLAPSQRLEHERLRYLLRSELEAVRADIKSLSESAHGRLDLIVEKLLDLDQRSELTWEQVREWAKNSPESEKASIRARLEAALGGAWGMLEQASQDDLIDSEVVLAECKRHGSGWRCAAIGYCTALERELKRTVECLTQSTLARPTEGVAMLGELIEAIRKLGAWLRQPKGSGRAVRSISGGQFLAHLEELNSIRKRTAHPQKVTQTDVQRLQALLLGPGANTDPLLAVVVGARG